ncbi:methyl-accepting chemotaxis protein [Anaerotignum propionicum]|uniref:methyl-accepting chemotaxis protein n=1 Tax=Anaerotignum propionicum TaxID=28446 RepID=UPI0028965F75|nr:methyl-accepting chemotaxis protein [Anaerotignum propionicum]
MKSIKGKLIFTILILVIISSSLTGLIGLAESFKYTDQIMDTLIEDRLTSSNNMLEAYLKEQFGTLGLNASGDLIGLNQQPIEGNFAYIDKFSEEMNVVATVFVKKGSDFKRIITTIKDENGDRVIGTNLDTTGKAYEEVSKGNTFWGEADILGSKYMTSYRPIYDGKQQIIGAYFVGMPVKDVHSILTNGLSSTIKIVLALAALVLLIVGIITYFTSRGIAKPIQKVTSAAQQIAEGNFNVELSLHSKDEIGQLAKAFRLTIEQLENYQGYINEIAEALHKVSLGDLKVTLYREYNGQFKKLKESMDILVDNLNGTLLQINQSADQVHSGAEQVANAAQALSQGATEQASSIQELSASITEVAAQIERNAANTTVAQEKAEFAGNEMTLSNGQMAQMTEAMNEISVMSMEISKIIKIIDDIAFQTNILALNAAVEAARAGAAGKGFAVVADEVRNLAGKSAEAAKNTTVLIEKTIHAVKNGAQITEKTANSLSASADVTNEAIVLIEQIAQASQEQAAAIAQINLGIEQISIVVQTNAATAEESAAASQELSGQSNILNDLISEFKLDDSTLQD